jgi:ABC-type lipoprotein release transport system permease subunit
MNRAFGVPALHLATLFGTALVMTAVSLVACLIRARRASRVDPMIALGAE